MSTRSVITIIDEHNEFSIYRHCDGYPDSDYGVIATLPQAFEYAWELPRFEAMDFAAAIIRAWKTKGGNIYFTTNADDHDDLEYRYEIRQHHPKSLTVTCFERVYRDENGDFFLDKTVWKQHTILEMFS